jgi:hypothetical protein
MFHYDEKLGLSEEATTPLLEKQKYGSAQRNK